jgi:nucleoside triphosphatase
MKKITYPRGIEIVGSIIIENDAVEILLAKSTKWGDKWVFPGGHVEPGERIAEALAREGHEETGLDIKPIAIFHFGELLNSKDFHRNAHFIFFDVYGKLIGGEVHLDPKELDSYQWITPQKALSLDLGETFRETLEAFIFYKNPTNCKTF